MSNQSLQTIRVIGLLILFLVSGCRRGSVQIDRPEELDVATIRGHLRDASDFDSEIDRLEIRGDVHYDWGRANKVTQPPDEAFLPVIVTLAKSVDGATTVVTGNVVYSCPPGSAGPWNYERFWLQRTERVGMQVPSDDVLRAVALEHLRGNPGRWLPSESSIVAIRGIRIPRDSNYRSPGTRRDEWETEIVVDCAASGNAVRRMCRRYLVSRNQSLGDEPFVSVRFLSEVTLSTRQVDARSLKRFATLADTSVDEMLAVGELESPPPLELPATGELLGAIEIVTAASDEMVRSFFSRDHSDRTPLLRICSIDDPVLRTGTAPRFLDDEGELLQAEITYTWMERSGPNEGTVLKMPFRVRFRRRTETLNPTSGSAPKHGERFLAEFELVHVLKLPVPNRADAVVEVIRFGDADAIETLKPIWQRSMEARLAKKQAEAPGAYHPVIDLDRVDRADPSATAQAALVALQADDFALLARLCQGSNAVLFTEMAIETETHPAYASFHSGWRRNAVSRWRRGELAGARQRDEHHVMVPFFQLDRNEFAVVKLEFAAGRWWFDGIGRNAKLSLASFPPYGGSMESRFAKEH